MKRCLVIAAGIALFAQMAAAAQLLPSLPRVRVPDLRGELLDHSVGNVTQTLDRTAARALERTRQARVADFLQLNRSTVSPDDRGFPAVRGVVLLTEPEPTDVARLATLGFTVVDDLMIPGLDLHALRLASPDRLPLAQALKAARRIAGERVSADNIHFRSGRAMTSFRAVAEPVFAPADGPPPARIGMIDGGVAATPLIPARVTQKGFAPGAPAPDPHATAVASLLIGEKQVRGSGVGTHVFAADIYGRSAAGGGALAIAQALGWMVENRVDVVVISLVGPENALLSRAVALSERRGLTIVAAVGNDGPAAPPAYPASYPGVLAITAVDAHNRVLPEAGHARHLDYAAPGADMVAAAPGGDTVRVRGTSFAAPLVAGRLATLIAEKGSGARAALDREAIDLGRKGPDDSYGRGVVCADCATRP